MSEEHISCLHINNISISIYLYSASKIVELTDTVSGPLTESNEPELVEVLRLVEVVRVELVWVGEAVLLLGQNHQQQVLGDREVGVRYLVWFSAGSVQS